LNYGAVQGAGVAHRLLPPEWAPRYLGFPCGAPSLNEQGKPVGTGRGMSLGDHRRVLPSGSSGRLDHLREQPLTEQRQRGTQPSSFGMGLDHDGGQFITDIGFEIERDTQSSRRGTGSDLFEGAEIRNGHQHDEVRDLHPSPADKGMGLAEFERGVRGLRRLQSERQIGTSHDVQPVERGGVLHLQESVLRVGYSRLSTGMTLLDFSSVSSARDEEFQNGTSTLAAVKEECSIDCIARHRHRSDQPAGRNGSGVRAR